jgi:hypothetical protein
VDAEARATLRRLVDVGKRRGLRHGDSLALVCYDAAGGDPLLALWYGILVTAAERGDERIPTPSLVERRATSPSATRRSAQAKSRSFSQREAGRESGPAGRRRGRGRVRVSSRRRSLAHS